MQISQEHHLASIVWSDAIKFQLIGVRIGLPNSPVHGKFLRGYEADRSELLLLLGLSSLTQCDGHRLGLWLASLHLFADVGTYNLIR